MAVLLAALLPSGIAGCGKPGGEQGQLESSGGYDVPADRSAPAMPGPASQPSSPEPDVPVILALGDSLTEGYGVPPEQSWPARLQARLAESGYPHRVVNAGVSGDTSAGGLARMDWLMRQRVDILIVALGANDGLRGLDPEATRTNLAAIIERSQARGATVVLAGMRMPYNVGEDYRRRYDSIFPDLAKRYRLTLIPFLLEGVATRRNLNLPDGIHPTGEGYGIVTENVWRVLEPVLRRNSR
jgi:acyl-CoA thioesterase-1